MSWAPIATAPKDGTIILLLVRGRVVEARWGCEDGGDYNNLAWEPTYCGHIWRTAATHWMPLPPPPEAQP